jgi:hypothetical protein
MAARVAKITTVPVLHLLDCTDKEFAIWQHAAIIVLKKEQGK